MKDARELQAQGQSEQAFARFETAQDLLYEAREEYLAARADQSRNQAVLIEFAELCERLQDYDLAGEAYERAAESNPAPADLWFKAGKNFVLAGGRYGQDAIEALNQARTMAGGNEGPNRAVDILTLLGDQYWNDSLISLAEQRYMDALAIDQKTPGANVGLACIVLVQGDPVGSSDILDRLGSLDPAGARRLDRMLREAFLTFQRKRVPIPDSAAAHRAFAKTAVRLGFLAEARLAVEKSLRMDDSDVFSWNLAGSLAAEAGDRARARAAFERSLALDPDQPRTRESLQQLKGSVPETPKP